MPPFFKDANMESGMHFSVIPKLLRTYIPLLALYYRKIHKNVNLTPQNFNENLKKQKLHNVYYYLPAYAEN